MSWRAAVILGSCRPEGARPAIHRNQPISRCSNTRGRIEPTWSLPSRSYLYILMWCASEFPTSTRSWHLSHDVGDDAGSSVWRPPNYGGAGSDGIISRAAASMIPGQSPKGSTATSGTSSGLRLSASPAWGKTDPETTRPGVTEPNERRDEAQAEG
jgi:hypothetical protein